MNGPLQEERGVPAARWRQRTQNDTPGVSKTPRGPGPGPGSVGLLHPLLYDIRLPCPGINGLYEPGSGQVFVKMVKFLLCVSVTSALLALLLLAARGGSAQSAVLCCAVSVHLVKELHNETYLNR
ncbi:unnamed protein product [Merluccius merluccius]